MINQNIPVNVVRSGSGQVANANTFVNANPVNQPAVAQPGVIYIPGNFGMMPVPPAMSQVVASATGGGAVIKTVYFGNEAFFNASPTDNGSGAASISNSYADGWSGKGYNQLANTLDSGNGVNCYGFTLQYITTSTGAQNAGGLITASPTVLYANLVGQNQIPVGALLSSGQRNTQFLSGTMTVSMNFKFNSLMQLSYTVPVGNTATLTIMTQPFV